MESPRHKLPQRAWHLSTRANSLSLIGQVMNRLLMNTIQETVHKYELCYSDHPGQSRDLFVKFSQCTFKLPPSFRMRSARSVAWLASDAACSIACARGMGPEGSVTMPSIPRR